MIHTDKGKLKMKGSRAEICGDLYVIFSEAINTCPRELFLALEKFSDDLNGEEEEEEPDEETSEEERAMAAALMLALLPEAEREKLKKKTEEE